MTLNTLSSNRWRSKRRQEIVRVVLVTLLRVALGFMVAVPFFWLVTTSLKPENQLFRVPVVWIPQPIMWSNYVRAVQYIPFFTYLKNTLTIAVPATVFTTVSSSFVAYGFSRIQWPGRDAVFMVLISTMMLPYQVTMVPLFVVFKNLGWIDTYRPLVVPTLFGGAFYIFLIRQFLMSLPMDLQDAARIDGCSELRIYAQIMLPLTKPALATTALLTFIGYWNEFLMPLIYINTNDKFPLALGLQQFQRQYGAEWALLMAASTLMTIPIIILFFATQKTFIRGIALTGIKG
ncbi:MAG: carbohydrate ABC transporter permease [Firmicutes bacterium]|jgi:multiple sugar transport system permease protein|nr:carbohydrate ABC transporter permease [Bacillota bacterium]